ncbi:MAG: TRAP transporter small permease subunit [Desulfamplus sp.]|nr:TRAP transporter small permease subunit [Desulfamplus sp.]
MSKVSEILDKIVIKQGHIMAYLMPLLVIVTGLEVFRRYALSAPSIWALEFTTFLFGIHFIMGFSYTEQYDGHVSVDIVTARLSEKARIILWLVATLLLSLPSVALLAYGGIVYAYESVVILEKNSTAWSPPIWPVKLFIPLGFLLLLMQIVSNILKKIEALKNLKNK